MAGAGAAKRYAQAAFDIAKQQNELDRWERDLNQLSQALTGDAVAEFFENPVVPVAAKQEAIEKALPNPDQRYVRNLALLLLERGRLGQLPDVVSDFHSLVLQERGIAIAGVTTAVPLTEKEQSELRDRLSKMVGKTIELRPSVDPNIIGGLVVRIGDNLIDGSIRTQLSQLRNQMVNG
ncbi:MAG TPA: ATP synthase F1 subunit delta [Thermomicrobiaceae bacterium]|nr:ATP synthase F1 subunit delta [Thermomicrobiaceae bacterium]